ncbi:MAG: amidohydrolase family protein [Exilibacterium sp.]
MTHSGKDAPIPCQPSCPPPDPKPKKPDYTLPKGSVDSHCHVFGPVDRFPFAENRSYTPPESTLEAYQKLALQLGFQRAVFVHTLCYRYRHESLLDTLERGRGNYRGVALISENMKDEDIALFDLAGVCGARINFIPYLGASPSRNDIERIVSLVRPYGWHIALHTSGSGLLDMAEFIMNSDLPVVIDHLARLCVEEGKDGETFQALLRLLDTGHVWVKLSGIDRISRMVPPYTDALKLARIVAKHAPERILWGTDWPHPNKKGIMPNDGVMVDLIPKIVSSAEHQRMMLVDNPEKLFRFDTVRSETSKPILSNSP